MAKKIEEKIEAVQFMSLEQLLEKTGGTFPFKAFITVNGETTSFNAMSRNEDGSWVTDAQNTDADGQVRPAVLMAKFSERYLFTAVDPNATKSKLYTLRETVNQVNSVLATTATLMKRYGKFLRLENGLGLPETTLDLSSLKLVVEERSGSFHTAGDIFVLAGADYSTVNGKAVRTRELAAALSMLTRRNAHDVVTGGVTFTATRDGILLDSDLTTSMTWKEADEILEYLTNLTHTGPKKTLSVHVGTTAKQEGAA